MSHFVTKCDLTDRRRQRVSCTSKPIRSIVVFQIRSLHFYCTLNFAYFQNHLIVKILPETIHLPFSSLGFLLLLSKRLRILDSDLYVIGYGVGKIILKLLPFWISNEDPQERQSQMKTKSQTNTSQWLRGKCNITLNFPTLNNSHSFARKAGISK